MLHIRNVSQAIAFPTLRTLDRAADLRESIGTGAIYRTAAMDERRPTAHRFAPVHPKP